MKLASRLATSAAVALTLVFGSYADSAYSELITYTLTGEKIFGTLNGIPFNSPFTITADADSSTFVSGTSTVDGESFQSQAAVSTMTLVGFAAPFQITTVGFGPFVVFDAGFINGQPVSRGGFGIKTANMDSALSAVGNLSGDIINGGGTISGNLSNTSALLTTSAGNLVIDGYGLPATATFNSVVAVPEPSTYAMALAGLACGGFSVFRRRKRA